MAEGVGKVVIQRKYGNKYLITDVQKQDIKDWNYSTRSWILYYWNWGDNVDIM